MTRHIRRGSLWLLCEEYTEDSSFIQHIVLQHLLCTLKCFSDRTDQIPAGAGLRFQQGETDTKQCTKECCQQPLRTRGARLGAQRGLGSAETRSSGSRAYGTDRCVLRGREKLG